MRERVINSIQGVIKKGAHYVILGSFCSKFAAFFGSMFLVRALTKSEYGILSYYENIYGYFMLAAGFGLSAGLLRYIIIVKESGEKKWLYSYAIRRGETYNAILVVLFVCVCLLYPHPQEFLNAKMAGVTLVLIIPFQYLISLSLSALRGLFDYALFASLSFLTSLCLIVARVVGAKLNGLYGSVLYRLAGEILCACVCVFIVFFLRFRGVQAKAPSGFVRSFNVYSIQIMFTDGLWALFMLNDVFMLSQLSGNATAIADYKIAYVIPANLSLISSSIGVFSAPYFTKKDSEGDTKWVKSNLRKLRLFTLLLMFCAAALCGLLAKPIIEILFGHQYLTCVPIFRVLLAASVINNGFRYTTANIYSAIGLQRKNLMIAGMGVIAQIIINSIAIPYYGAMGVAFGSVGVQFLMSAALSLGMRNYGSGASVD